MNNKDNGLDTLIGIGIGIIAFIWGIFVMPITLIVIIPAAIIIAIIATVSDSRRDEYFKARQNIMLSVLFLGVFSIAIYFLFSDNFKSDNFLWSQDIFVVISFVVFLLSIGIFYYREKFIPVSFIKGSPQFVQQTMYADYDYIGLKERFLYRGVKFLDNKFNKYKPKDLKKVNTDVKSIELDITDLEVETVNKEGELRFYYKKLIYDFYNDFFLNDNKNNKKLLEMYGYNPTFRYKIKTFKEFEKALKKESLLYCKILFFLKKDIDKIDIKMNFQKIHEDNLYCLELTLLAIIQYVRFYANFPVGDLGKYCQNYKDRNFLGAFNSLPTDFRNIKSTTIAPLGIGYYYLFYQLHYDWINSITDEEFVREWGSES